MNLTATPLTLRQLQYAVAVAETRNFRRAAERCAVSQPALSAQLAALEETLGARLFERGRSGVLITVAGEDLVARARRVLLEVSDLAAAAARHRDPLAGTLRIGVIPTIGPYVLPLVAPRLRAAFPHASFVWVEDKTDVLLDRLARGELDAALLARVAGVEAFALVEVGVDRFVLALPPGHELARGKAPVKPSDLAGEAVLLLDDGHCFRDQALAYCAGAGAQELGYRATSLPTLVQMVAGGAGVTLLPEIAVETERAHADLAIRTFAPREPARTVVLAWRASSPLGDALAQVAATIRAAWPVTPRPGAPATSVRPGRRGARRSPGSTA